MCPTLCPANEWKGAHVIDSGSMYTPLFCCWLVSTIRGNHWTFQIPLSKPALSPHRGLMPPIAMAIVLFLEGTQWGWFFVSRNSTYSWSIWSKQRLSNQQLRNIQLSLFLDLDCELKQDTYEGGTWFWNIKGRPLNLSCTSKEDLDSEDMGGILTGEFGTTWGYDTALFGGDGWVCSTFCMMACCERITIRYKIESRRMHAARVEEGCIRERCLRDIIILTKGSVELPVAK